MQEKGLVEVNKSLQKICGTLALAAIALNISAGAATPEKEKAESDTKVDASTGSASVPVNVTRGAATFSVTVPTSLPVSVKADGTVATATDAAIINNGSYPVSISKVEMNSINDWGLTVYDKTEVKKLPVDTKKIGMELTIGGKTIITASDTTSDTLSENLETSIEAAQRCLVSYNAAIPAQSAALTEIQVANVIFTVGWA